MREQLVQLLWGLGLVVAALYLRSELTAGGLTGVDLESGGMLRHFANLLLLVGIAVAVYAAVIAAFYSGGSGMQGSLRRIRRDDDPWR